MAGELGLHARPAAEFARSASRFASEVRVAKGGREADAKSVLLVLTLDVRRGDRVRLSASGPDAESAVEELARLVASQ